MTNTIDKPLHSSLQRGYRHVLRAALLILLTTSGIATAQRQSGDLTVLVSGFKTNQGHAIARLYLPGNEVTKKGQQEISATIHDGKSNFVFPALPAGVYAVVVFHDANDNGTVDHNFFGLPVEALGFSNGFRVSLTSGMPNFEKLRFAHGNSPQTIQLNME
ncbi:DUF2141 domain-containing protein [Undibacterium sp. Di27W]